MARVSVIMPAAGTGKRFNGRGNKIFETIGGRAIFLRTLDAFAGRDDVVQLLLVVSAADEPRIRAEHGPQLEAIGATVVRGGATRSESVRNALASVIDEAELIAVHDAVRPCVAQVWIDAVFAAAARSGAAILAYPVHGTLKRVAAGGVIERTVSREELWEAQTPQVFAREVLQRAYDGADAALRQAQGSLRPPKAATDDAELVQRAGQAVTVVMGDPRNVKITTPADLAFAAAVIDTLA